MTGGWGDGGSTRAWRRVRARVLDRDGHLCRLQLDGCTIHATTVHHSQPWRGRPEQADPATLQAACWHCNNSVGSPDGSQDPDPKPWRP